MEFFNSAVDVLKTLVVALGAGLGVWGAVNLMEGYGGDNPSAKSQGMQMSRKQAGRLRTSIFPAMCGINCAWLSLPLKATRSSRSMWRL